MNGKIADAPRLLFAGVSSGCGKTTVVCAVLQALVDRGIRVNSFKCGPDYIDPMFHERIIGVKGSNLDLFFYQENTVRYLLAKDAGSADISVIEGAMGYYDGRGIKTAEKSTYEVAGATASPAVLVMDCKAMSYSAVAVIRGFFTMMPESGIKGVILNNVSGSTYTPLRESIYEQFGGKIKVFGYFPPMKACAFESRHLGLVTAAEINDIKQRLRLLAEQAEKSIDIDGLIELASAAAPISFKVVPVKRFGRTVSIAVAMDKAFCFYYRDNLELLRRMGAELVPFSPLSHGTLPDCDGLYLGGGYPELYKERLSGNEPMHESIKRALTNGLPCIAECGGFMYLTQEIDDFPMAGFLPGRCRNMGRLTRFGYVTLTAKKDNMLCKAGEKINAHEFHHYDAEFTGDGFSAVKGNGSGWDCVFANERLYAGYPHIPFFSNTRFAENFYSACIAYRKEQEI